MSSFTLDQNHFVLDGQPFRILAGAMHYFRVPPQYWDDRLLKLRAWGSTPSRPTSPGTCTNRARASSTSTGCLDLERYIELAAELGLKVIVRPGPYICSEWDFGGLPAWLLADPGMRLRCVYPPYLEAVDRYLDALLPRLAPLQVTRGGPIIAMQVENEYGSYGNDKTTWHISRRPAPAAASTCLLFTSDGPSDAMLQAGTLPRHIQDGQLRLARR